MAIQPDKAKKIVLAAVVVHNFLRECSRRSRTTTEPESECMCNSDILGGMTDPTPCQQKHSLMAKAVRNNFADYFISTGQIEWQWGIV